MGFTITHLDVMEPAIVPKHLQALGPSQHSSDGLVRAPGAAVEEVQVWAVNPLP